MLNNILMYICDINNITRDEVSFADYVVNGSSFDLFSDIIAY